MTNEIETMTYMIAAEKMSNLLFTMENTLEFLEEYKVKPDEAVKSALKPLIEQTKRWIES
jgi:hypothetical protein